MKRAVYSLALGMLLQVVCGVPVVHIPSVSAEVRRIQRHPDFAVPERLRARVDFWKDIFTRYGENEMVVHHRDFPQIRFTVLDFRKVAAELTPIQLEKLKKDRSNDEISRLKAIFKRLGTGAEPASEEEEQIYEKMRRLPGGVTKFREVVEGDLIRTQTGIKEKFALALQRSGRYLPIMERIFKDYGLPIELTRLPFIESSFDYEAYSSVGAAGIWQFMRKTGMLYMTVNSLVDERRDPIEATRAAARYLEQAYNQLGTWPLAITSYNHGVYGVAKKVRQWGTSNLAEIIEDPSQRAFGFASTNFYPEFLAALEVHDNYRSYFPDLELWPALSITQYRVPQSTQIQVLARRLGVPLDELRAVNYAISDRVWSGRMSLPRGYVLKIPDRYETKVASLHMPDSPAAGSAPPASSVYGGITYRVRKGDTLLSIAKKYKTTVADLLESNSMENRALIPGESLKVRAFEQRQVERSEQSSVTVRKRDAERTYRVAKGDNLWSIARKLGISVQDLKRKNNLSGNQIREGQSLRVPKS
ncbi:MAG: LysM peptidoglycan-binding domain-containing protein [Oligoflexia bacterium]|nr:LysM peptidoglycan-binding domain-containing protein [Oligoflexia bacterium]